MFPWIHLKVDLTSTEEEGWIEISKVEVVLHESWDKGNLATVLLSSGDFKKCGTVASLENKLNGEDYFETTNFVAKEPNLAATIFFLQRVGVMEHSSVPSCLSTKPVTPSVEVPKPSVRVTFTMCTSLPPLIRCAG